MRMLVATGFLGAVLAGPAFGEAGSGPGMTVDLADIASARAALIGQCPPVPNVADAASLPIHVTRWGTAGPRVLIIHGGVQGRLGGGPATFDNQKPWGAAGWRVERVDRPGFGQSPSRGVDDMQRDAIWIADMLGDGANLIGHSWGGAEALLAAARRPAAVQSLVLVEPALSAIAEADPTLRDNPAVRAGAMQRAKMILTARTPAEYGAMFANAMAGPAASGHIVANAETLTLGADSKEAMAIGCALLQARMAPFPAFNEALKIVAAANIPVLIVTGGWNSGFDAAGDVLARLTHGRHVIVRSPSHFIPLLNPRDFNKVVGDFMRDANRGRSAAGLAIKL